MDELRISLFQHAPRLGDTASNIAAIAAAANASDAHLFVTPELSVTGYDVRDQAHALALPRASWNSLAADFDGKDRTVVTGLIEAATNGAVYNAAVAFRNGVPIHAHRKIYLPTYGMFDEARFFARGTSLIPLDVDGWRIGVLICEDFWHPGLIYALAAARIDALFVLAAAPGRGVFEGGEHGDFASADSWERMARTAAQTYGMYVALANRVGVEGAVTFAGGSVIVAPTGQVVARAGSHGEATLRATFRRSELLRARRPYFHGRDDDPRIVIDALLDALGGGDAELADA